jgi:prolyl 4-hydroxylase
MLSFEQVVQQLQQRDPAGPTNLERLAKQGNPQAQYMLGELLVIGTFGPPKAAKGYRLIAKAAAQGHVEAMRAHAYLTAAGTGCVADRAKARDLLALAAQADRFAATQWQLDIAFEQEQLGQDREILSEDPLIYIVRGFLSVHQCQYLRTVAQPWLAPAMIVHPISGEGMLDPIRRSQMMNFGPMFEDLIIQRINRRIAEISGTQLAFGEPLSVLHYRPGDEYRAHLDAFDQAEAGQQRTHTALIWLNDGFEGGETRFHDLDIDVRGNIGDLLVFRNVDADGKCDRRTRHAGLPVTSSEKWLASRWIRDGAFIKP